MAWLKDRFRWAFQGLRDGMLKDKSIRLQILIAAIVLAACLFLKLTPMEWLVILFCCFFVVICETMNSCLEQIVDLVSPEYDKRAGKIKDMAASAVLLAALFAVLCAGVILVPKILVLIQI